MGVQHHSLFTIGIESIFENSVHSSRNGSLTQTKV